MAARRARVITVSDGVATGNREDTSGAAVAEMLIEAGFAVTAREVVADDVDEIRRALGADVADLVVTTGGTGLAARDVTPEATRSWIDYEVPGLAEEMRRVGREATPMALLSRAVAGVHGRTLVVNLPGSEKGARESLAAVLPVLDHALDLLGGKTEHRA
jgi:molybdenum cofactor synthesis domain-containing protein